MFELLFNNPIISPIITYVFRFAYGGISSAELGGTQVISIYLFFSFLYFALAVRIVGFVLGFILRLISPSYKNSSLKEASYKPQKREEESIKVNDVIPFNQNDPKRRLFNHYRDYIRTSITGNLEIVTRIEKPLEGRFRKKMWDLGAFNSEPPMFSFKLIPIISYLFWKIAGLSKTVRDVRDMGVFPKQPKQIPLLYISKLCKQETTRIILETIRNKITQIDDKKVALGNSFKGIGPEAFVTAFEEAKSKKMTEYEMGDVDQGRILSSMTLSQYKRIAQERNIEYIECSDKTLVFLDCEEALFKRGDAETSENYKTKFKETINKELSVNRGKLDSVEMREGQKINRIYDPSKVYYIFRLEDNDSPTKKKIEEYLNGLIKNSSKNNAPKENISIEIIKSIIAYNRMTGGLVGSFSVEIGEWTFMSEGMPDGKLKKEYDALEKQIKGLIEADRLATQQLAEAREMGRAKKEGEIMAMREKGMIQGNPSDLSDDLIDEEDVLGDASKLVSKNNAEQGDESVAKDKTEQSASAPQNNSATHNNEEEFSFKGRKASAKSEPSKGEEQTSSETIKDEQKQKSYIDMMMSLEEKQEEIQELDFGGGNPKVESHNQEASSEVNSKDATSHTQEDAQKAENTPREAKEEAVKKEAERRVGEAIRSSGVEVTDYFSFKDKVKKNGVSAVVVPIDDKSEGSFLFDNSLDTLKNGDMREVLENMLDYTLSNESVD